MSWPQLSDMLCARFPHLNPTAMTRFRGDRATLNLYLARTHDLTLAEAALALDDWLAFSVSQDHLRSAA